MSETGDKRRRGDLDLFVLALIDEGLATPYRLQLGAGLSPGATIPALQRLLEAGLILQGKAGPRGRSEHRITSSGRRQLEVGWRAILDRGPTGDLEADLRIALLILWLGGDRKSATDFLRQSAARISKASRAGEENEDASEVPQLAYWYRKMRSASAKVLAQGEAKAAMQLVQALPRPATVKRKLAKKKRNLRSPI